MPVPRLRGLGLLSVKERDRSPAATSASRIEQRAALTLGAARCLEKLGFFYLTGKSGHKKKSGGPPGGDPAPVSNRASVNDPP